SGVKPTGTAHIGNYFGAMKQMVDLQNSTTAGSRAADFACLFMIADYHALNLIQNGEEMKRLTFELAADYLAIGLDPKKSVIFKQSDVSAHTELAWVFDTIVTMPYLMRAHAFKDAEAKEKEINVGTFNYPVLMAADILLYDTDTVPVGQDQKQHVEYARDIALKFNHIFKNESFKLPEAIIMKDVATVPGTDGRKMSKSYGNIIPLFATREEITKAVMGIVTDSGVATAAIGAVEGTATIPTGIPVNVYNIHKLFRNESELAALYEANKGKYKVLKEALIEDIDAFIKPMRERRAAIVANPKKVMKILAAGAKQANKIANKKMEAVKKTIGVAA
ncbi:MAG: tryptophan--tRNA ligase, partial [bacterium]